MDAKDIEQILQEALKPLYICVQNDSQRHKRHKEAKSHGGGHFSVLIYADCFRGLTLIARHKLIYQALKMPRSEIHALSIVAKTSEEKLP
ncbi:MAG: BolA family transcriptional regulator [Bdellovibrionales bacterium]|nr:BolA family transcriptional regulator [Bdellovibrionales bacterium]